MTDDLPIRESEPLPDDVLALPGRAIFASLGALGGMIRILDGNARDLIAWLDRTDDPEVMLQVWNADKPEQLDRHLNEVERLLFNFAAAAHARVDFYRKTRSQITAPLDVEYHARLQTSFLSSGLHHWLMGARNYMSHHRLPKLNGNLRGHRTGETFEMNSTVLLDCRPMFDAEEFNVAARTWMQEVRHIDVRGAAVAYKDMSDEFDKWFGTAFARHHVVACEQFMAARDAAIRARYPWLDDGTDSTS